MQVNNYDYKLTLFTPPSYAPRGSKRTRDKNVDAFVKYLLEMIKKELKTSIHIANADSEAFIDNFDEFEKKYLTTSEYAVFLVTNNSMENLAKFYPRLFVFLQSRPTWSNRFVLLYLGNVLPKKPFDESLFTNEIIRFHANQWKNESSLWTKLYHFLSVDWEPLEIEEDDDDSSSPSPLLVPQIKDENCRPVELVVNLKSEEIVKQDEIIKPKVTINCQQQFSTNAINGELDEICLYHEIYPNEELKSHDCNHQVGDLFSQVENLPSGSIVHTQSQACSWDPIESRCSDCNEMNHCNLHLPLFLASVQSPKIKSPTTTTTSTTEAVAAAETFVDLLSDKTTNVISISSSLRVCDDYTTNVNENDEEIREIINLEMLAEDTTSGGSCCNSLNRGILEEIQYHDDHWIYTSLSEGCSWKLNLEENFANQKSGLEMDKSSLSYFQKHLNQNDIHFKLVKDENRPFDLDLKDSQQNKKDKFDWYNKRSPNSVFTSSSLLTETHEVSTMNVDEVIDKKGTFSDVWNDMAHTYINCVSPTATSPLFDVDAQATKLLMNNEIGLYNHCLIITPIAYCPPPCTKPPSPIVDKFLNICLSHQALAEFHSRIRTLKESGEAIFTDFSDFEKHLVTEQTDGILILVEKDTIKCFEKFFARLFVFLEFNESWRERIGVVYLNECKLNPRYDLNILSRPPFLFENNETLFDELNDFMQKARQSARMIINID